MKICILTPRFPFPENGGDVLRINNVARYLKAQSHYLILVSFTSPKAIYYRRMRTGGAHMMSFSQTWCNAMRLMCAYSSIYWTHTREYSFRFYTTRLLGAIHQIIDSLVKKK